MTYPASSPRPGHGWPCTPPADLDALRERALAR